MVRQYHNSGEVSMFSRFLKTGRDRADVTSLGRLFHTLAPATGKARPPTVDICTIGVVALNENENGNKSRLMLSQ